MFYLIRSPNTRWVRQTGRLISTVLAALHLALVLLHPVVFLHRRGRSFRLLHTPVHRSQSLVIDVLFEFIRVQVQMDLILIHGAVEMGVDEHGRSGRKLLVVVCRVVIVVVGLVGGVRGPVVRVVRVIGRRVSWTATNHRVYQFWFRVGRRWRQWCRNEFVLWWLW